MEPGEAKPFVMRGRRRNRATAVLFLLLSVTVGVARADHPRFDPDPCRGTIGGHHVDGHDAQIPEVAEETIIPLADAEEGPFYLVVRDVVSAHWYLAVHLYQETNAMEGLQMGSRGMPWGGLPGIQEDDPCWQAINPDTTVV